MKIKTTLILVELDNGQVHQVLASKEQKEICMALLRSEDGVLRLSERVEPVTLEKHPPANVTEHPTADTAGGPQDNQSNHENSESTQKAVANDALFASGFYDAHVGQEEKWAAAWLNNETDYWPDNVDLPGEPEQVIHAGCPSSPMPCKAQERIGALRDAGERYVIHVDSGVHAYRIGYAREYLANVNILP